MATVESECLNIRLQVITQLTSIRNRSQEITFCFNDKNDQVFNDTINDQVFNDTINDQVFKFNDKTNNTKMIKFSMTHSINDQVFNDTINDQDS